LCPLQKIYPEKVTIEVLFEVASSRGNLVLLIIYIITFNFVMQMLLCKVRLAIQKPSSDKVQKVAKVKSNNARLPLLCFKQLKSFF